MKKICFSEQYGLQDAVLKGRKTQTRRMISDKLWEEWTCYDDFCHNCAPPGIPTTRQYYHEKDFFLDKAPYKVGEIIAIAQRYSECRPDDESLFKTAGWKNKMFVKPELMPNRIRITNVCVERLQDISEADIVKEGICFLNGSFYVGYKPSTGWRIWLGRNPREAYAALIDKVSGKGTWESNPYVFVYDFELIKESV